MSNITLSIDDQIVKKVRKLALERNTSLTALIRENLQQLAAREDLRTQEIIDQMKSLYGESTTTIGEKTWTREDLYE